MRSSPCHWKRACTFDTELFSRSRIDASSSRPHTRRISSPLRPATRPARGTSTIRAAAPFTTSIVATAGTLLPVLVETPHPLEQEPLGGLIDGSRRRRRARLEGELPLAQAQQAEERLLPRGV